jgi:deazaflavin-dependent oxidoreductase (nitroreductase family)
MGRDAQRITLAERMYNRIETWILERVPREHVGGFFKWVLKVPVIYYRLGLGWMVGRFILLLTTTGRKTGKKRQTPLEYEYDAVTCRYRIAAGWGGRTDWYRNLRANPRVTVQVGREKFEAIAEPAPVEEIAGYMMRLSQRHPRMDRIWNRFADCPVDGTWESYLRAARSFPAAWLRPVEEAG